MPGNTLRIGLAQVNPRVGDVAWNQRRVLETLAQARAQGVQLLLFPELVISGYPPEDLLLRPDFVSACEQAVAEIARHCEGMQVVLGHPQRLEGRLYNMASWLADGQVRGRYCKQELPNYLVFDEKRWFDSRPDSLVVDCAGQRLGVLICEDLWAPAPARAYAEQGVDGLLVLNASPFQAGKREERLQIARAHASALGLPVVYVNLWGGQDDLVFDGAGFVLDGEGRLHSRQPAWQDDLRVLDWPLQAAEPVADWPEAVEDIWQAVVTGTRDYITKSGFSGACLGLSGGIDSAVTLAVAVEAVGAEQVHALMLPTGYTEDLSLQGAAQQARTQGVRYDVLPIEETFRGMERLLQPVFDGRGADVTEENLQSRIRGTLLMALSNKSGKLLLATGNKSELATGYATLYGDMNGGYAPLKDCYKTVVYQLARWVNREREIIPWAVIERPPSAELAPGQRDSDSLPDYPVLDALLRRLVEEDASRGELLDEGFAAVDVDRVIGLLLRNEYKRRQGAPGPKVTARAFGRDRRYPIVSGWRP